MPLFKKKNKQTPERAVKPAKKGKKFGFSRKAKKASYDPEEALIPQLQLDAVVPDAIADNMLDAAETNPLVKQTGTAFDVLVVTEQDLADAFAELDDDVVEDSLGNLSASLHNDAIENATTEEDLAAGQIVIVPSTDTLTELTESNVMVLANYHIGHFPVDGDLNDGPVPYDDETVSLSDLMKKLDDAEDEEIDSDVDTDTDDDLDENDAVRIVDTDDDDDEEPMYLGDDEDLPDDETDDSLFGSDEDDDSEDDELFGSDDDDDETIDFGGDDDDVELEASDGLDLDDDLVQTDEDVVDELDDESKEVATSADKVVELSDKVIKGADLELHADTEAFNQTFIEQPLTLFELTDADDSELQKAVNNMKANANTRLRVTHNRNLQHLTQLFNTSVSKLGSWIQSEYSYNNPESDYAKAKKNVEEIRSEALEALEQSVADAESLAEQRYASARQKVLAPQIALLEQQYDADHASEKQLAIRDAKQNVVSGTEASYKESLVGLEARRQDEAQQAFNKVLNGLIKQLQDHYKSMSEEENAIYEDVQAELNQFQQDNYVRETNRVEALRVRAEDMSEADRIRKELQSQIDELQGKLKTQSSNTESEIHDLKLTNARLEAEKSDIADKVAADYRRQLDMANDSMARMSSWNEQLQKAVSDKGQSSFRSPRVTGGAQSVDKSTKDTNVVPAKKPKISKKSLALAGGSVLAVAVVGGTVVNSMNQQNAMQAKISQASSNYNDLNKNYVVLSKSSKQMSSDLKKAKSDASKSVLTNDNSYEAKSTKEGSSDTIRVAKSDTYNTGQSVLVKLGSDEFLSKVTNVDNDKHTVTVHVDSKNQDFVIQK